MSAEVDTFRQLFGDPAAAARRRPPGTEADRLLAELVTDDPLTCNVDEGMGDHCFFCGADSQYEYVDRNSDGYHWAEHKYGCAWVAAMRYLGRDLGHHKVAPIEVPRSKVAPMPRCTA